MTNPSPLKISSFMVKTSDKEGRLPKYDMYKFSPGALNEGIKNGYILSAVDINQFQAKDSLGLEYCEVKSWSHETGTITYKSEPINIGPGDFSERAYPYFLVLRLSALCNSETYEKSFILDILSSYLLQPSYRVDNHSYLANPPLSTDYIIRTYRNMIERLLISSPHPNQPVGALQGLKDYYTIDNFREVNRNSELFFSDPLKKQPITDKIERKKSNGNK